ncbi:energy transducer TonB [Psychroflexus salinarum]|uniref:Energy transducer TonB n=1 Tax=Psychroflexus salinarum TaxID=546024 RepID=A0ABW3GS71_9FLAO
MKRKTLIILSIFIGLTSFGQTDCVKAESKAKKDYKEGKYNFHSLESLPIENTYHFVLRDDFNIKWRFIDPDSLDYYSCYDLKLTDLLKKKFGQDFLKKTIAKVDSLEKTENWKSEAKFPGGKTAMLKFIDDRLKIENRELNDTIQTRMIILFAIKENGELDNVKAIRGINDKIDKKVVEIFNEMPNWKPAYLYGKPIRKIYSYAINL